MAYSKVNSFPVWSKWTLAGGASVSLGTILILPKGASATVAFSYSTDLLQQPYSRYRVVIPYESPDADLMEPFQVGLRVYTTCTDTDVADRTKTGTFINIVPLEGSNSRTIYIEPPQAAASYRKYTITNYSEQTIRLRQCTLNLPVVQDDGMQTDLNDVKDTANSNKAEISAANSKIQANSAVIDTIRADYVKTDALVAATARITKLETDSITTDVLEAYKAEVHRLYATQATVTNLSATVANINTLVVNKADITDLNAAKADIVALAADKADIVELNAVKASIGTLDAGIVIAEALKALEADVTDLTATRATIEDLNAVKATIGTLEVGEVIANKLHAHDASIGTLTADKANVAELNAVKAQIGTLEVGEIIADKLHANAAEINRIVTQDLVAVNATINNLKADKANITELNATNANISNLTATVANIQTLVGGHLTMDNIQSLILSAEKVTVANAFIKDAMVDSLSAAKITSGSIDTNKVTITSADGSVKLTGNLQQFKDANGKVRVQIGKDASGNFSFGLFDTTGTGTLIDANGIKPGAIGDGIIVNDMISDTASISGSKLDINSVINEVNQPGTTVIKSTKVKLDTINQTLDVAFGSLKTTVDGNVTTTNSHTTSISAMQGSISTLISDTTVVEDGVSKKLKDAYSSVKISVDGISTNLGQLTTTVSENQKSVTSSLSSINQSLTGITQRVANTETTTTNLTASVGAAQSAATAAQNTANSANNKIDNLEIGGRNLAKGTGVQLELYPAGGTNENTGNANYSNLKKDPYDLPAPLGNLKDWKAGDSLTISYEWEAIGSNISGTLKSGVNAAPYEFATPITLSSSNKKGKLIHTRILTANDAVITSIATAVRFRMDNIPSGTIIKVTKLKIEIGNVVTDWSPAPEDVDEAIDDIHIGTRNLIANSAPGSLSGWNLNTSTNWSYSLVDCTNATRGKAIRCTNKIKASGGIYVFPIRPNDLINGETYTLSVMMRASNNNIRMTVRQEQMVDSTMINMSTEWKLVTFTSKVDTSKTSKGIIFYVDMNTVNPGDWFEVHSVMFAQSTKIPDYMEAPEDVATDIKTVDGKVTTTNSKVSTIETNLNGITQRVGNTETTTASLTTQIGGVQSQLNTVDTRVSSAESKLTKSSLTTIIGNAYTNTTDVDGIVTSKGYQTSAQVKQTVEALQLKFSESGGYNLLYNGNFKDGINNWLATGTYSITNTSSCPVTSRAVTINGELGVTKQVYQEIRDINYAAPVFLGFWAHVSSNGVLGSTNPFIAAQLMVEYTDGTKVYPLVQLYSKFDTWERRTMIFTPAAGKRIKSLFLGIYNRDSTKAANIAEVIVAKSVIDVPYSANPNEVFDGITNIDKNGITVTASNAATKTIMNANGFFLQKLDGTNLFKVDNAGLEMVGNIISKSSTETDYTQITDGYLKISTDAVAITGNRWGLTVKKANNGAYFDMRPEKIEMWTNEPVYKQIMRIAIEPTDVGFTAGSDTFGGSVGAMFTGGMSVGEQLLVRDKITSGGNITSYGNVAGKNLYTRASAGDTSRNFLVGGFGGDSIYGTTQGVAYLGDCIIIYGSENFTGLVANEVKTAIIKFRVAFDKAPCITLTGNTSVPHIIDMGATSVSATQFNLNFRRTNSTDTTVFWMAIGQRG